LAAPASALEPINTEKHINETLVQGFIAESIDDKKWRIEGDARTLKDAEMIKADPERLKDAMAFLNEEMKALMNELHITPEDLDWCNGELKS
jgi:hypothetical protein